MRGQTQHDSPSLSLIDEGGKNYKNETLQLDVCECMSVCVCMRSSEMLCLDSVSDRLN